MDTAPSRSDDEGILALAALTPAERDALLARLLGDTTLRAMEALRDAVHAAMADPTNPDLADAVLARWEDVMCEHVNRTISVTGTILDILDKRVTADAVRITADEVRITDLEERSLDTREAGE